MRNICESSNKSTILVDQQRGRLLRIGLTDGHTMVYVVEYRSMPAFSLNTAPGTKVTLENNISVQNGILLGDARSLTVLGGHVQALYEAWEIERKYSALARATLKTARIEGDTGPPPFHGLSVAKQAIQDAKKHSLLRQRQQEPTQHSFGTDLHAKDIISHGPATLDSLESNTMSRSASLGKGVLPDNFGVTAEIQSNNDMNKVLSSWGKTGREPYRSPVLKTTGADVSSLETGNDWSSDQLPELLLSPNAVKVADGASTSFDSESKKGLRGLMPSEVSSSSTLASSDKDLNVSARAQQKEMGIDSRVDAIRAAMALGVETAPLQNRTAAQKLLDKRSDGDFKNLDGRGRGFLARGRGRRAGRHGAMRIDEEKGTLTLDEWESRKGFSNFPKNQTTGTDDDAALAQKLQHQLDLESNIVATVGTAHDEAEQIRLSMFNYTVDRSADGHGGEKRRGRGRGRGRRHGR